MEKNLKNESKGAMPPQSIRSGMYTILVDLAKKEGLSLVKKDGLGWLLMSQTGEQLVLANLDRAGPAGRSVSAIPLKTPDPYVAGLVAEIKREYAATGREDYGMELWRRQVKERMG